MALQVMGSGFGRTGTMSTKTALEMLGFDPCHHMIEVMGNPAQPAHWQAVAEGGPVDWHAVFDGYNAQVDWPGAAVWEQTALAFPEAKVLHNERPAGEWWNSFSGTIGKFFTIRSSIAMPPPIAAIFELMGGWFVTETFGPRIERETAIAAYRRNNEKVRDTIPADRLLVFTPTDGWEPLCRFLEVPVPQGPFPRSHARDEFWAHFGGEPTLDG